MILIYKDIGVGEHVLHCLEKALNKRNQQILMIDSEFIINEDLSPYKSLIIPGGADLPYCEKLNGMGNQKIKNFVANGGTYLGICAGAYYGCSSINFKGEGYEIQGDRELAFFKGSAIGSLPELSNGVYFNEENNSKNVVDVFFRGNSFKSYYHGGPEFIGVPEEQILATYPNNKVSAVFGDYEKGYYILTSFHFEVEEDSYKEYFEKVSLTLPMSEEELALMEQLKHSNRDVVWDFLEKYL